MRDISEDQSILIWLRKACGSDYTFRGYLSHIKAFFLHVGVDPDNLIAEWRKVKYDYRRREMFIDEWTDNIEAYIYDKRFESYTPLSQNQTLTSIASFFLHHRIPVKPTRKRYLFVKFHNRDIKREEIKRILEHSKMRDRTFFLMMAESGLRPHTLVQLRYKHIKEDFEKEKVPMKIELPSELLKDRVEPRWTFIGQDGFRTLKEYLKQRLPLKNEDLIFEPERKSMKHEFLSANTFTNAFHRIVTDLGITEKGERGKPKKIRLYCLRKYFNNNIRADRTFIEFWMGHKTTQTHYISRDFERHREEYENAYENLRIYKPEQSTNNLRKLLEKKDKDLAQLRESLAVLTPLLEFAGRNPGALQKFLSKLAPEVKGSLLRRIKWMTRSSTMNVKDIPDERKELIRKHRQRLESEME